MRALVVLVLVVALIGGGLKLAGVPLPLLDYPLGPIGVDAPGPAVPNVRIEAPGFDEMDDGLP